MTKTLRATDLGFTSNESFGLFMEGLRAIQRYGDESDKNRPCKESLDHLIVEAETHLRVCVAEFPDDPLPRYYLGVVLTTRNQHLYVERLVQLKESFIALGRSLYLKGEVEEAEKMIRLVPSDDQNYKEAVEERDRCRKLFERADRDAGQAKNLDQEPWPLLHDAAAHFSSLLENSSQMRHVARNPLRRAATYNLAEVYARLDRSDDMRDDITAALEALDKMEKPLLLQLPGLKPLLLRLPWWKPSARGAGTAQPGSPAVRPFDLSFWESTALDLQTRILQAVLLTRRVLRHGPETSKPGRPELKGAEYPDYGSWLVPRLEALDKLRDELRNEFQKANLPRRFQLEVRADYWIKMGYLTYERALHPLAWRGESCDKVLNDAQQYLLNALGLKPNWNAAQIYLALVYRVRSGIARATGQAEKISEADRYARRADDLFRSLQGSSPAAPAPEHWQLRVEGSVRATPESKTPEPSPPGPTETAMG